MWIMEANSNTLKKNVHEGKDEEQPDVFFSLFCFFTSYFSSEVTKLSFIFSLQKVFLLKPAVIKAMRGRGGRAEQWGKPAQRSPDVLLDVKHPLTFWSSFSSTTSDMIFFFLVKLLKTGIKCLNWLKTHCWVCFSTRELHIWVPAPDDVKMGDDPKPTAQRLPYRGRLRFPFLYYVTSSCLGEPLRRPQSPNTEDKFHVS